MQAAAMDPFQTPSLEYGFDGSTPSRGIHSWTHSRYNARPLDKVFYFHNMPQICKSPYKAFTTPRLNIKLS